jgi:hypothetical protein
VADEAFEALWRLRGGPEITAFHALFAGRFVPIEPIRQVLGLTLEQLREVLTSAAKLGLLEADEGHVAFMAFAPKSAQRGRLDWCLEGHREELELLMARLRSVLLVRFLSSPPENA